jgi:hypothetical protein
MISNQNVIWDQLVIDQTNILFMYHMSIKGYHLYFHIFSCNLQIYRDDYQKNVNNGLFLELVNMTFLC